MPFSDVKSLQGRHVVIGDSRKLENAGVNSNGVPIMSSFTKIGQVVTYNMYARNLI
jgi:hypothetical protein